MSPKWFSRNRDLFFPGTGHLTWRFLREQIGDCPSCSASPSLAKEMEKKQEQPWLARGAKEGLHWGGGSSKLKGYKWTLCSQGKKAEGEITRFVFLGSSSSSSFGADAVYLRSQEVTLVGAQPRHPEEAATLFLRQLSRRPSRGRTTGRRGTGLGLGTVPAAPWRQLKQPGPSRDTYLNFTWRGGKDRKGKYRFCS